MTRNRKLIIAGVLSATAIGGAAVAAETLIVRGPMRADTNGDGVVSRAEFFTAAETRFKDADTNGDRMLSGDEMADPGGRFARLDANNDGKLSFAEEAAGTNARFARLDADRDGKLTPEELGPRRPHGPRGELAQGPDGGPVPGAGMLRRLDTDGDGRISRAEMRAQADQRFDRLDTNKDGVIDRAELQAMRGPGMGRRGPGTDDMPPPPPPPPAAPPAPENQ